MQLDRAINEGLPVFRLNPVLVHRAWRACENYKIQFFSCLLIVVNGSADGGGHLPEYIGAQCGAMHRQMGSQLNGL